MRHADSTPHIEDMKMTVEGLLPHNTRILKIVYIITIALTSAMFIPMLFVFM